jgi:hypothetical protein
VAPNASKILSWKPPSTGEAMSTMPLRKADCS